MLAAAVLLVVSDITIPIAIAVNVKPHLLGLGQRNVVLRRGLLPEVVEHGVRRDADDRRARDGIGSQLHALPDCVLTGPVERGEGLVGDHHLGRARAVGFRESPSTSDRQSDRLEEVGGDTAVFRASTGRHR
jgi:hypothetical protein